MVDVVLLGIATHRTAECPRLVSQWMDFSSRSMNVLVVPAFLRTPCFSPCSLKISSDFDKVEHAGSTTTNQVIEGD